MGIFQLIIFLGEQLFLKFQIFFSSKMIGEGIGSMFRCVKGQGGTSGC